MPQIINTNIQSLNSQRALDTSQTALFTALQRLSSGIRVNSSKDDAAGLAVAEFMNSQVKGMTVGMRNANDGISLIQVAEAGINTLSNHLQRMRELAVQAASGQWDSDNRSALDTEYQKLLTEVSRVISNTTFNGQQVIDGTFSQGVNFQVGALTTADNQISVSLGNLNDSISGMTSISGTTGDLALSQVALLDVAIKAINTERAAIGSYQNLFEGVLTQLASARESTEAARSRIMDADYGAETANLARAQILQQAGVAMLSQANALPQNVLTLLR